jgi:hypothetical protein
MSDTSPTLPAESRPGLPPNGQFASSVRDYSGWMMQGSVGHPQRVRIHRVYSEIELRLASAIADGMSTPARSGAQPGEQ